MAPRGLKRPNPDGDLHPLLQNTLLGPEARNVRPKTAEVLELEQQMILLEKANRRKAERAAGLESASSSSSSSEGESEGSASSSEASDSEEEDVSSAEGDDSEDDDDDDHDLENDERVTIAPQGPQITSDSRSLNASASLRHRLDAFLPKLRDANSSLDKLQREGKFSQTDVVVVDAATTEGALGTSTDSDHGDDAPGAGPYVEMDLGLGVLEHQRHEAGTSDSEEEVEDDVGEGGAVKPPAENGGVLGKLMGQAAPHRAPVIEEVP